MLPGSPVWDFVFLYNPGYWAASSVVPMCMEIVGLGFCIFILFRVWISFWDFILLYNLGFWDFVILYNLGFGVAGSSCLVFYIII